MSLTVVVSERWNGEVIRPAIWSGGRPVYCQTTPITGMRMSGKISVGVRSAARGPRISSRSASTTNVYGRLSAIRTSAIISQVFPMPAQQRGLALCRANSVLRADLPETKKKSQCLGTLLRSLPRHPSRGGPGFPSGRPDGIEELAEFLLEAVAVAGERPGRRQHL